LENSIILETQLTKHDAKESQNQQSLSKEIILELLEKLTVFENDKRLYWKTQFLFKNWFFTTTNTNTSHLR
jgi:hypothetical protein